jgi:hypothetical protein
MNEEEGVIADETASQSPEETNVQENEPVVEEKVVPYDRFQEVVKEKNAYKELLASVPTPVETPRPVNDDMYVQPVEDVSKLVEKQVEQKFGALNRQLELDRTIQRNPDFFNYAEPIKAKIQENPNLAWDDAYKLAKYDASISQAMQVGRQEAVQQIQAKKRASVEPATKTKNSTTASSDDFNPLAKGPDGRFLYSTKELEDILPRG